MKLTGNKIFSFMLAAAFALTLAGCGGGGGTAAVEEEPPAMPEPSAQEMCEGDGGRYNADGSCTSAEDLAEEMALSGAQGAASAAAAAAMMAVGGAVDPVAAANAYGYAKMAAEASEAADAATTSADAMGHQAAAETARDKAMEAAGKRGLGLTAKANMITNQADIDNAVLEGLTGDDIPDPASNAGRVGTALATTAAAAAAVSAGDVSQGTAASADATYGASGPTFAVTGVGTTLQRGEAPALLTMRGDWMGRELVEEGTTDSYVNVYTDIQAPKMTQNYDTGNPVTLAAGQLITGDIPGDGSAFTGTLNLSATDNIPTQTGRFNCPDAASGVCSISVDEKGAIVASQGYVFEPIASGMSSTPDSDYLAWGVWLTVPDDTTSAATAGAFASGNQVFTVKAALKGTATYNGVATGMYAAGGMVEYFDADASLNANFGGTVAAGTDNLLGAVTGSISNIKAGGMDVEGSVTLKRATIADAGGTSTAGFTGETSGTVAGRAVSGMWGGQFYGPSNATGNAAQTQYPTTAAGTFGAAAPGVGADTVRILGSFGTWKAE